MILALLLAAGAVDCLPPQPIETPCLATLPAEDCTTLADGSVHCPAGIEVARTCSICTLRSATVNGAGDLAVVVGQRDQLYRELTDLAGRHARLGAELEQVRAGARSRATWAWGLGVSGTILQAGAVAVLLAGGSKTIAAGLAGFGAAAAAAGVVVATW